MLNWWKSVYPHHSKENKYFQESDNIWFDVEPPTELFTGREEELMELHNKISRNQKTTTILQQMTILSGSGGVGKTELAKQYIQQFSENYDFNIIWINAADEFTLSDGFRRLANEKLKNTKFVYGNKSSIYSIKDGVYEFFSNRKCLFVFDNAVNCKAFRRFLPLKTDQYPYILIISRNRKWNKGLEILVLFELSLNDATTLLKKGLNIQQNDQNKEIEKLANKLQCSPLVIQKFIEYSAKTIFNKNDNIYHLASQYGIELSSPQHLCYNKKKRGYSFSGLIYAIQLCMVYLLDGITNNNISWFYLASNLKEASVFGDVVFRYDYNDNFGLKKSKLILLQVNLKDITEKGVKISLETLLSQSHTGKFILRRYLSSYFKIKYVLSHSNNDPIFSTIDDYEFIVYTNIFFNADNHKEHIVRKQIEKEHILNINVQFNENNYYYQLLKTQKTINALKLSLDYEILVKQLSQTVISKTLDMNQPIFNDYHFQLRENIIKRKNENEGMFKKEFLESNSDIMTSIFEEIENKTDIKSISDLGEMVIALPKNFGKIREDDLQIPLPKKSFNEEDIEAFLSRFKLLESQPNEYQLEKMLQDKIVSTYNLERHDITVFSDVKEKIRKWWRDSNGYLTKENNFFQESAKICFLFKVKPPTESFTGRKKELIELHSKINGSQKAISVMSQMTIINGMSGIGKTELVRGYVSQFAENYDSNIIWINSENQVSLSEEFFTLAANKLKINTKLPDGHQKSIETVIDDVYQFFSGRKCLFIFDNAVSSEAFVQFLPLRSLKPSDKIPYILITSSDQQWGKGIRVMDLSIMDVEDAVKLLKKGLNIQSNQQDKEMEKLVKILQCFPLAIRQSIEYIKNEALIKEYNVSDYLKEYERKTKELLISYIFCSITNICIKVTFVTWRMIKQKIEKELNGKLALNILSLMVYMASDNVKKNMFLHLSRDENRITSAVQLLVKYSMIKDEQHQGLLSIQKLVQEVIITELTHENEQTVIIEKAFDLFACLTSTTFKDNFASTNEVKQLLCHLEVFLTHVERWKPQYAEAMIKKDEYIEQLFHWMNSGYVHSDHKRRIEILEKMLKFGKNRNKTKSYLAKIILDMGNSYVCVRDYHKAKELLEEAVNMYKNIYGLQSAELIHPLECLSAVYGLLGNLVRKQILLDEKDQIRTTEALPESTLKFEDEVQVKRDIKGTKNKLVDKGKVFFRGESHTSKNYKAHKSITAESYLVSAYKIELSMHLLLQGSNNGRVTDFCLASNVKGAADFSDIVFRYRFVTDSGVERKKIILLQVTEREEKTITMETLLSRSGAGQFLLRRYLSSYSRVMALFSQARLPMFSTKDNYELIVYTTALFNTNNNKEDIVKKSVEPGHVLNVYEGPNKKNYYYQLLKTEKVINALKWSLDYEMLVRELAQTVVSKTLDMDKFIFSCYHVQLKELIIEKINEKEGMFRKTFLENNEDIVNSILKAIRIKLDPTKPTIDLEKDLANIIIQLPDNFGDIKEDVLQIPLPSEVFHEKEIKEFLSNFKLFVSQPNVQQLREILQDNITNVYNLERNDNSVFNDVKDKMLQWWIKNDYYLTRENTFFQESAKVGFLFDVKPPTKLFTGREKELMELHNKISRNQEAATLMQQTTIISGCRGIGKTELARKYIQQFAKNYDSNIIWINAENKITFSEGFMRLGEEKLKIDIKFAERSIQWIVDKVFHLFSKCLFVFDNILNYKHFTQYLPLHYLQFYDQKPYILIISLDRQWNAGIKVKNLLELSIKDAVTLVKNGLNIQHNAHELEIRQLVTRLQCFPLAIRQSIAYIKNQTLLGIKYNICNYLEKCEKVTKELLASSRSYSTINNFSKIMYVIWMITASKIKNEPNGHLAFEILAIMAYIAPENINKDMFLHLSKIENEVMSAVRLLVKYLMFDSEQQHIPLRIHRLVQETIRIELSYQEQEAIYLQKTFDVFNYIIPYNIIGIKQLLLHLEIFLIHIENWKPSIPYRFKLTALLLLSPILMIDNWSEKRRLVSLRAEYLERLYIWLSSGYLHYNNGRRIEILQKMKQKDSGKSN